MAKKSASASSSVNASLGSIVEHFEVMPDPHHQRDRRHLLVDVITFAVLHDPCRQTRDQYSTSFKGLSPRADSLQHCL